MQDIEATVMKNYKENMDFFAEKHKRLHSMILALETLLSEGKYPQKYELEYKDGYFDVIELATKTYLYNQDSNEYSKKLVDEMSFRKDDQVFESFYNFLYDDEGLELLKMGDAFFPHVATAPIVSYHQKYIDTSMSMRTVYKFIFLGVGLGLHIKDMVKKMGTEVIFITDTDIELFRLSMFTCNYKESLGNKLTYFSIAQNSFEFGATFQKFFEYAIIRNHYLKFSMFSLKDEATIKEIQKSILTRPEKCYSYSRLLEKNRAILKRLNHDYKFLNVLKKETEVFFNDKPVLILAAGPSLQANIEWLKQNHNKYVIFAPLAALQVLYKEGIKADVIVHIDENEPLAKRELDSFEDKSYFDDSIFVFTASVPQLFFDEFDKDKVYLLEDRTTYKGIDSFIDAASVGEATYGIALSFSNSDVYTLGLDLALGDDGGSHAKDHSDYVSIDTSGAKKVEDSATLDRAVLEVKGNFREKVNTIPLLMMSIPVVDVHTVNLRVNNQNIYNLSDGAYFKDTTPLNIEDVKVDKPIQKDGLKDKLVDLFDKYSSKCLSEEETQKLMDKNKRVQDYYNFIKTFKESSVASDDVFMQNYVVLLDSIVKFEQDELHQIMINYLLSTTTYVSDFFNTKELDNKKTHIKKLKKMIVSLMKKVIQAYEGELSKVVNELEQAK